MVQPAGCTIIVLFNVRDVFIRVGIYFDDFVDLYK